MAVAPSAGDAVGAILNGQWKLIRLIGEGGLAGVYEAEGATGQGRRAIKLLHPHFRSQPQIMERFYAEAQACFSLRHPNIATVESYAYAEDGSPYIVMELLTGISLEGFLSKKQPMRPEQAAPIAFGILKALSAAHASGIVHRDLKPANLFLVPAAQAQYDVKVLDFGIAKVMDVAGGMGTKTRTGAVLGTPGYMSPEQVKNAKAVDPRSDLWAVGVVFYEMLTCHHPYGQADQLARMVAVLRDPPMPITRIAPHLGVWEPFFHKALERNPEARFQSAEEMADKLREIAQSTAGRTAGEGLQTMALPTRNVAPTSAMHAAPVSGPVPTAAIPLYNPSHSPSTPPPAQHPSHPPPAAPAGARAGSQTQVSETRPVGVPTIHSDIPMVHVTDAAEPEPVSLVWWGVLLVGVGCFALGLMVGYLLAG